MALPALKKRKTDHTSSDDSNDERGSFASFGGSEEDTIKGGADLDEDELPENNDNEEHVEDGDIGADWEEASDERSPDKEPRLGIPSQKLTNGHSASKQRAHVARDAIGGVPYSGGTFKSNMFKLQVDELLSQIRPKHRGREAAVDEALHTLKSAIERIPARGPLSVEEAERNLSASSKVAVPFPNPRPPTGTKYRLEYAKPTNINVVGSYPQNIGSRTEEVLEVDMVVVMPRTLFQEKDYLNHRYFYKRAYYLACIAAGLKDSASHSWAAKFSLLHCNPLQPILAFSTRPDVTDANVKPKSRWQVNIIPALPENTFLPEKLVPDKNCVRSSDSDVKEKQAATPFYNSSLHHDQLVTPYLKLVHSASSTCEAFRDACLLGRTWLRQRGLGGDISNGGFGNFEWTALVALLLRGGGTGGSPLLSPGYSSYQLFKATLQVLAMRDMAKQPMVVGGSKSIPTKGSGQPMLFDASESHDLLFKMTSWSYDLLRREARTTLNMLNNQLFDPFDSTFIVRCDRPLFRYDCVVEMPRAISQISHGSQDHKILRIDEQLKEILTDGVGDRVTLVTIHQDVVPYWDVGTAIASTQQGLIVVGLTVNPETVNRTVDHGPSAEDKLKAAAFRKFWGDKAELRRFKDGSILESLVWSTDAGKPSVMEQIIRHVLARHLGAGADGAVTIRGDSFNRMLRHSSGLSAFQPLMEAYKAMENHVRSLEGLPLTIRQIMPADSQLRYSSLDPPMATHPSQLRKPADVVVQFEGSGRWPDDLVAIQRTKIAFLLKISELMQEAVDSVTARIGLENEEHDLLNQAYLDIVYDSGAAFRMRIHHDREQTLLERQLKDKSLDPKTKETAAIALAAYKRHYIRNPAHTQAVQKLCTRYPVLSPTIRLTKKWFKSHLLSEHFPDELIELLVLRTFVQPWPWQGPSSLMTGFLRTLFFLSRWDWRNEPLIVDFDNKMNASDVSAMTTRFEAWRKLDPALNRVVLFAASSVDPDGTTWTDGQASKVVAGRMTALARAATFEAESKELDVLPLSLFTSPLSDYDFVIHMTPEHRGQKRRKGLENGITYKNLQIEELSDPSLVGFDPAALFVGELREQYGQALLLFYGHGQSCIGGLWNPHASRRNWKVNLAYSTVPIKRSSTEDVESALNKDGVLAEIARLGGDLVAKIEVSEH